MLEQEINTIGADEATERYSDTSPDVVRVQLKGARDSSSDLNALLNRRNIQRGRSLMLGDFVYRL